VAVRSEQPAASPRRARPSGRPGRPRATGRLRLSGSSCRLNRFDGAGLTLGRAEGVRHGVNFRAEEPGDRGGQRHWQHASRLHPRPLAGAKQLGNWADLFKQGGYAPLTPDWPDDPETVHQARANPDVLAKPGHGEFRRGIWQGARCWTRDRHPCGSAASNRTSPPARSSLRRTDRTLLFRGTLFFEFAKHRGRCDQPAGRSRRNFRSSRRGRDSCVDPRESSQLVRGEGDEQDKPGQDAKHNGCGRHKAGFVQSQSDTSTRDYAVHRQDC
jgi:hypothetical protein